MEEVSLNLFEKIFYGFIFNAPFFAMMIMPIALVYLFIDNRKRKPINYERTEKTIIFGFIMVTFVLFMFFG